MCVPDGCEGINRIISPHIGMFFALGLRTQMRDDLQEIVCPERSLCNKPIKVDVSHLQSKLSYCPSCKSLLKIICKYC